MSQRDHILKYLMDGKSITPLKAQAEFGAFRLAAIIHRLRDEGYVIDTVMKRSVAGKPYAEYTLRQRNKARRSFDVFGTPVGDRGSYNRMGW